MQPSYTQLIPPHLTNPDPKVFLSDNFVVLDFENTIVEGDGSATNPDNKVVLSVWYVVQDGKVVKRHHYGNELTLKDLMADLDRADFMVAHNSKHELQWLKRAGWDIGSKPIYCTMLGQKVLYGNLPYRLDLDSVAAAYKLQVSKVDLIKSWMKRGLCPSTYPRSLLTYYGYVDVDTTYEIFIRQRKLLASNNLLPTQFTRCIFTPVLADIEFNGCYLDRDRVTETYQEAQVEYNKVVETLQNITKDINLHSPKQLASFLYDPPSRGGLGFSELRDRRGKPKRNKPTKAFPDGLPKTDKDVIAALKATTKIQKEFKALKSEEGALNAALTKTLKPFYLCATEKEDPIIYFKLNQHITKTHRLSSTGKEFSIQGQNMPNKYKRMIRSRDPEFRILEADYSKLEFVGAAMLSQDPVAIKDVVTNFDVHKYSAAVMKVGMERAEEEMENITKEERRLAKPDTFGPLYGKTSGTKAQVTYFEAFKKKYEVLAKVQDNWIDTVLSDPKKALTTITGLKFYFPYAEMTRTGYIKENTKIRNWPIQSFSTAECVPVGVTYLWYLIRDLRSFIINTIHDSAIMEVHESEVDLVTTRVEYGMLDRMLFYMKEVYNIDINIPIEVEQEIGTHWGEGTVINPPAASIEVNTEENPK